MKVFTVYTTDVWETTSSEDTIGIFSTIVLARENVLDSIDEETKVVIKETTLDKIDSNVKMEVYSFKQGLEYKSDTSKLEIGSQAMAYLSSSYYEIKNKVVLKEDIERVINVYQLEMEHLGAEPEIEYIGVDEFLELSDTQINHILYHAELYNDVTLVDFYKRLKK